MEHAHFEKLRDQECVRRVGIVCCIVDVLFVFSHTILQGVDVELFKPHEGSTPHKFELASSLYGKNLLPATDADLEGKWILFSGGKLEVRKGQDLIVAAFKKFLKMHDDVVLVTAWHNQWKYIMKSIQGPGFVKGSPETKGDRIYFTEWLEENGIPADRAYHLDETNHATVAALLKRADAAIFTNRGEGGTNLVSLDFFATVHLNLSLNLSVVNKFLRYTSGGDGSHGVRRAHDHLK